MLVFSQQNAVCKIMWLKIAEFYFAEQGANMKKPPILEASYGRGTNSRCLGG